MLISIEKATSSILEGNPIAIPTDTVYGLAASYNDVEAVKKIYALKKRPPSSPLIILLADVEELPLYVEQIPKSAYPLIERFWPGALTLIFSANTDVIPPEVRFHGPTIGIRIPNHNDLRALIRKTGPLVATSANRSGNAVATNIAEIEEIFGKEFPILTSKEVPKGSESTIISLQDGIKIIREGLIANELRKIKFLLHTSEVID